MLSAISGRPDLPSSFQPQQIAQIATTLPTLFNTLHARHAIIPAANAHLSARALARYYAALADGGKIPPPHSTSSKPVLGSHPHIPKLSYQKAPINRKCFGRKELILPSTDIPKGHEQVESFEDDNEDTSSSKMDSNPQTHDTSKVFMNPKVTDEFLGTRDYENLALPSGSFGLGFKRFSSKDGSSIAFGHSGMGGSTGYCDVTHKFGIAVTLNKMSFGSVTGKIVQLVCSELNIPVPDDFLRFAVKQKMCN